MKALLLSQRIVVEAVTGERRDALDARWGRFLRACGYLAVPMPNRPGDVAAVLDLVRPRGIVLTGGNDLASLGGDVPERDETEEALWREAQLRGLPLLGVCRGMQFIQHRFGVALRRVEGHIRSQRHVLFEAECRSITCYHDFASIDTTGPVRVDARADDGVVEAISIGRTVRGIMWHPERLAEPHSGDIRLVQDLFP